MPYAAYKLLRLLRWFELPGPWEGWQMHSGKLWTPEGLGFDPSDSAWWGVLVRKAAQFDAQCRLTAKLQVRVAELCSMLDDAPSGLEVLVTPQERLKTEPGSAAGGEVLVTPHKRLKNEPAAVVAGPEGVTSLVTRHKHAKNGADWSVQAVSGRWFNYDRGQPYRGAR
nr:hypothetical protein [uncultured bacterium]